MVLELYDLPASPPCRAVKLTLKALNLDCKFHLVDARNKEHLSDHYLKMNPQHTFPVLVDDDFAIWDSHAINGYLVDKYGANDELYPKDPQIRAIINQRLYFECGVLFSTVRRIMLPVFLTKTTKTVDENEVKNLEEAYDFVEKFLARGTKYIASDHITIADFSFVTTMLNITLIVPKLSNKEKYPLIDEYLERCKQTIVGYEEINSEGLKDFEIFLQSFDFVAYT